MLRTQNAERRTQNAERRTQNAERRLVDCLKFSACQGISCRLGEILCRS